MMFIPQKIIDNSTIILAQFIKEVLKSSPDTNLDIATAFFNIRTYELVKDKRRDKRDKTFQASFR